MPSAQITFTVNPPIETTNEQLLEWIDFELGVKPSMSMTNPLHKYELDEVELKEAIIIK
jgi:hypothetical protein